MVTRHHRIDCDQVRSAMSGAARQSSYRTRQRAGLVVIPVEVDEVALVEALTLHGFLTVDDPSQAEISDALARVVAIWTEVET